jgi:hypothetical protein
MRFAGLSRTTPAAPSNSTQPREALEYARGMHLEALDTNRGLHSRTQVALALDGVILSAVGAGLLSAPEDVRDIADVFGVSTYLLAGAAGASLVLSILFCVRALSATHKKGGTEVWSPEDRSWFFAHVAESVQSRGREDFIASATNASAAQETRARLSRVAVMSPIMLERANAVNRAFLLTSLALVLFALAATDYVIRLV